MTTTSTLLMSKEPLNKEGHRQLLDMFVDTGDILVLLYYLNKYRVPPIIYDNIEQS